MIADIETGKPKGPSIPFEIIVVADKPDAETVRYLESEEYVRAIIGDNLIGTEAALNKGLKEAKGDYLCYLMSDVEVVTPGAFDTMSDTLDLHPEFGWVALSSEHTGFLAGCSMFTREAFEKVGLWAEEYESGGGFSDDDYLRRMWKVGYKPHILVGPRCRHAEITATTSLLGTNEKMKRFKRNQELFRRKYGEEGTNWNSMPKYQPPPELHRIDWIKSKVTLRDKILELGCAENPTWAGTPFKVTTVDISRRPDENCSPDIVADAANLPLGNKSYDIVCANELLEHVADPQAVLREAARVARKKVIITVPAEHLWAPALKPFWNPGHVRFYTRESFEKELETLGLPFTIELIKFNYWRHYGAVIDCNGSEPMVEEKVKINWGSFRDTFGSGWLNVDILNVKPYIPADHKFKQWDVRQKLTWLADNSVDLHRVSHLIEHLTLEEAKSFLSELYRTLKPGGLVRIATPDLDIIVKHYYNRDMSFFNAVEQPVEYIQAPTMGEKFSRLLFSGDYQHKAIYSWDMLKNFLEQSGFQSNKIFRGGPGFSHSELMQMETQDQHESISLFYEAVK
jgi:predicted SAM-dependent methyltransferase